MQVLTAKRSFVKCRIFNGGFSSERTFEINRPNADRILGIANVQYLRDACGEAIPLNKPARGESLDGFVECRIISGVLTAHGRIVIEVPGEELLEAEVQDLVELH